MDAASSHTDWLMRDDWRGRLEGADAVRRVESLSSEDWQAIDGAIASAPWAGGIGVLAEIGGGLSPRDRETVLASRRVWLGCRPPSLAFVWEIDPQRRVPGRLLHGRFFDGLRRLDPALADREHAARRRRFAWSVIGPGPAGWCLLRLTFWKLWEGTSLAQRPEVWLDAPSELGLSRRYSPTSQHPWCAMSDDIHCGLETLRQRHPPVQNVTIQWACPTVFRRGDGLVAEPAVELVIGSWARTWNAFAVVSMPDACWSQLTERLRIEVVRLTVVKTDVVGYGPPVKGMVGVVRLVAGRALTPEAGMWLSVLADFAFFAGTGAKTTMGLGATRRLEGGALIARANAEGLAQRWPAGYGHR